MPGEQDFLLPEEEPEEEPKEEQEEPEAGSVDDAYYASATARARALTDRLLKGLGQRKEEYVSEPLGIHVADVEASVQRFGWQLQYCRGSHELFPCLITEQHELPSIVTDEEVPLPVDLLGLLGPMFYQYMDRKMFDFLMPQSAAFHEWWRIIGPSLCPKFELSEQEPLEARGFFGTRLVEFLTARFCASRWCAAASPGLQFKVVTHNHGLRVHYSPAYFFNPWNVFGSPTSPVYGWIQPGRYMFGAVGPRVPLEFDSALFDIPPSTEARLVCA